MTVSLTVCLTAHFYKVCSNRYLLIDIWQREERGHEKKGHILKCLSKNVHAFFHLNFNCDPFDGALYVWNRKWKWAPDKITNVDLKKVQIHIWVPPFFFFLKIFPYWFSSLTEFPLNKICKNSCRHCEILTMNKLHFLQHYFQSPIKFIGLFPTVTDLFKSLLIRDIYKYSDFCFCKCMPNVRQLKATLHAVSCGDTNTCLGRQTLFLLRCMKKAQNLSRTSD